MARVDVHHDADADLVTFVVHGPMALADFAKAAEPHFSAHGTSCALWDLRHADLSGLSVGDLMEVAARSRETADAGRQMPRSAIVVGDDGRILARLYDALADADNSPVVRRIFTDPASARAWLLGGGTDEVAC